MCLCVCVVTPVRTHAYSAGVGPKRQPQEACDADRLPSYMQQCTRPNCEEWEASGREPPVPDTHWHCVAPDCVSRGLLQTKPNFACQKLYDAQRHVAAHGRYEEKSLRRTAALWRRVCEVSGALRPRPQGEVTELRKALASKGPAAGCAAWESRLRIGKTGPVAKVLSSAIERFGTGSYYGPLSAARMEHDPRTLKPQLGHHVRFHPTGEDEAIWYGVCCGEFGNQDVLGERGLACRIRWFDHAYTDTWKGRTTNFYQLTETTQPQLFDCMQDWGHLLVHDRDSGLFVDPGEEAELHESELTDMQGEAREQYGHPDNPNWQEEVAADPSQGGAEPTREELLIFRAVFRWSLLFFVTPEGLPQMPGTCGKQETECARACKWAAPFEGTTRQLPLITPDGPLFLTPVRYHCQVHAGTVTAGSKEDTNEQRDPYTLNVVYHRLRDMRYRIDALTCLHGAYVDLLSVAGCRRRLLDTWLARGLHAATKMKQMQRQLGLRSEKLQAGTRVLLALSDFVPSDNSISELMLVLYERLVKPQLPKYDAYVCAFDGQMMRIDGTFKCASVVRAYAPTEVRGRGDESRSGRTVKKVAGCVLVAVGLEGLCLTTPRLVRTENGESISDLARYVMRKRREVLGSMSAPAAVVTDSIRQHKKLLWSAITEVYPEVGVSVKAGTMAAEDAVLMLQDIPHREWVFTRQAAFPKQHPDRLDYIAAIKGVFHRLRVPHSEDQQAQEEELMSEWGRTWQLHAVLATGRELTETVVRNHILRGLLSSVSCTTTDDTITKIFLEQTGRSSVEDKTYLGEYIPNRILVRAARRLHLPEPKILELFPVQGYSDGDDFLYHLESVNVFYKVVRSQAHYEPEGVVASHLGKSRRTAKSSGIRASRSKCTEHSIADSEAPEFKVGISDKELVADAIGACAHEAVHARRQNVCECTQPMQHNHATQSSTHTCQFVLVPADPGRPHGTQQNPGSADGRDHCGSSQPAAELQHPPGKPTWHMHLPMEEASQMHAARPRMIMPRQSMCVYRGAQDTM